MNTTKKIVLILICIILNGIVLPADQIQSEPQKEKEAAIKTYLTVDWTSREVLWEHDIMPNDSGKGWEFWLADIDFDGIQEMLITFLANHCGQNSLYVYQYENNSVSSYLDMIATPDKDVITLIDYKNISPYMDIELADAYVNQQNEYRYLSIDCSGIGGVEQISLYETVLEDDFRQAELARITYYSETDQWEIYFKGDEVASAEALHDRISQYMDGYEKQEICYRHLEKSFPRDIFMLSADEKKRELEELYGALGNRAFLLFAVEDRLLTGVKERDCSYAIYEKYFGLKQGDLVRSMNIKSTDELGKEGFLNSHFGGITINVGEGVCVQYSNTDSIIENNLPCGIIIESDNTELGFMGARAGMDFGEIQDNAYPGEVQKGYMYNEEINVYYLEYFDESYRYVYLSYDPEGRDSWLLVEKLDATAHVYGLDASLTAVPGYVYVDDAMTIKNMVWLG